MLNVKDFKSMDKWSRLFVMFLFIMVFILVICSVFIFKNNNYYGLVSYLLVWLSYLIFGYGVCEMNYRKWLMEKTVGDTKK